MKTIKINEEIPENACILVLNWKGKKYAKGCKGKGLPLTVFQTSIEALAKSAVYTLDYIEKEGMFKDKRK